MTNTLIHKELAVVEDLALGRGQPVAQVRNGAPFTGTAIDLVATCTDIASVDPAKHSVALEFTDRLKVFVSNGVAFAPFVIAGGSSIARYSYITGSVEQKQQLSGTSPETVLFNFPAVTSPILTYFDGAFSTEVAVDGVFSVSAEVLRAQSGGTTKWSMFVELSNDGVVWQAVPDSLRTISLISAEANEIRHFSYTVVARVPAGFKFRLRHVTDTPSKQVAIVASPSINGLPGAAGVVFSAAMQEVL